MSIKTVTLKQGRYGLLVFGTHSHILRQSAILENAWGCPGALEKNKQGKAYQARRESKTEEESWVRKRSFAYTALPLRGVGFQTQETQLLSKFWAISTPSKPPKARPPWKHGFTPLLGTWDCHYTPRICRQGWLPATGRLDVTEKSPGTPSSWWRQVALRRQLAFLIRGNSCSTDGEAVPANRPPHRVTRIKLEIESPLVLNIPTYLQPENVYGNFHTEENVGCSPQKISLILESLHNGAFGYPSARWFLDQKF